MLITLAVHGAPPASRDLPMTPFVEAWIEADAPPEKLRDAAEAVIEHWADPNRIPVSIYVPDTPAQLIAALISLETAREKGLAVGPAIAEVLSLLDAASQRLCGAVALADMGIRLADSYDEAERPRIDAYVATLRALPAFVSARLPAEADAVLAENPKEIRALRARGRYERGRLDPRAALPWLERLAALSGDPDDLFAHAEAVILSTERDADAKAATAQAIRKLPEQARLLRQTLFQRSAWVAYRASAGPTPPTLHEALDRFADVVAVTGNGVHPAVVAHLAELERAFPVADVKAVQAGWLWSLQLIVPSIQLLDAIRQEVPKAPAAIAARLAATAMLAASAFAAGAPDLVARLDELDHLLKAATQLGPFERAVLTKLMTTLRAMSEPPTDADPPDPANGLNTALGNPEDARRKLLTTSRAALDSLVDEFKGRSGPLAARLLVDALSDGAKVIETLGARIAALDPIVSDNERMDFDSAAAILALRLGVRYGRPAVVAIAEERGRRIIERQFAFEEGIRKHPGGSTQTCPPAGCADIGAAFSLVGAARNARRLDIPEADRAAFDSATIQFMRRGERWLLDNALGWSERRAQIISHRCVALLMHQEADEAGRCAADVIDSHPTSWATALLQTALLAPDPSRQADAVAAAERVADNPSAPDELRFHALRWLAVLEYTLHHEESAKRRAREAREARKALVADGRSPESLFVGIAPALNFGAGFNYRGGLTASLLFEAHTASVLPAPVADDMLDQLADAP